MGHHENPGLIGGRMNNFEHGLLHYLSAQQLRKIQAHRVGIGGAGGLGSNAALALVRCGFKHFEILDQDVVEPSNLNRQQFNITDIGKVKVEALKDRMIEINPDLDITVHQETWELKNADHFFKKYDVVVEAFDAIESKTAFVDFYHERAGLVVSGSGMAGTNMSIPMEIKQLGNIFIVGDNKSETTEICPPFAPRVIQCAAMMAGIVFDWAMRASSSRQNT